MVVRTTLFQKVNVSASSNFSLYGLDSKGRQIGTYYFSQKKKLMRFNNFSVSLDFSLDALLKGGESKNETSNTQAPSSKLGRIGSDDRTETNPVDQQNTKESQFDAYGYMKFDSPWTMNISYILNCSKPAFKSTISQSVSVYGNIQLTRKMAISYNSGYDFTSKKITMTQFVITRDLHCWDMSFSWVPNGYMRMWEFSIKVKAQVLTDLKYERRKDFHDNY
jgi:hypothetical protein